MFSLNKAIEDIVDANKVETVWSIFCDAMYPYHFDRLIYSHSKFATDGTLGDIRDVFVLSRHDREFVDLFIDQRMYRHDPMTKWVTKNTGSRSWSYIEELKREAKLTPKEDQMVSSSVKLGVEAGYTLSFRNASIRAKGGLGLTARRGLTQSEVDEIWVAHGSDIELLSNIMHLRISQLPHLNMRRPLTARQSEVLQWIAEGKTIADTAIIMDLNPATVEKHLKLVRQALDVETTAQAILKTSSMNLLFQR